MNLRTISNPRVASVTACLFLAVGVSQSASAQGLLGIGTYGSEITEASPLRISVGTEAGYDTNTNTSSDNKNSSAYAGAGVGLFYAFANELTRLDLGGNLSGQWYDDPGSLNDDVFYNTRLSANASHRLNDRTRITNNSLVAYEIEPDYLIGASIALRDDQYLYFYNRTAVFYELSKRWSSVTGYAIQGITYEESLLSSREDRLTHTVNQQIRYSLTPKTTLKGEYRFSKTDYDSINYDSNSHFALAGVDHRFSDSTAGTFVAGAEFREYDTFNAGDSTQPYVEAGVTHRTSTRTSYRWIARAGLENNEVFGFRERYSYRTGVTINHAITDKLRATGGVSYVHSDFKGAQFDSISEDAVSLQAGLAYRIVENIDLRLGYLFTNYSSDDENRDYDRQRVSLGATATF